MTPGSPRVSPDRPDAPPSQRYCAFCGTQTEHGIPVDDGDLRLAYGRLFNEHAADLGRLQDARSELQTLRSQLDEAPKVECACHPGVRWPSEQWGRECPITKAETAQKEAEAEVLRQIFGENEHKQELCDKLAAALGELQTLRERALPVLEMAEESIEDFTWSTPHAKESVAGLRAVLVPLDSLGKP